MKIYESRGISTELAMEVARQMMADPQLALETHAREELGIHPDSLGRPVQAAFVVLCDLQRWCPVAVDPVSRGTRKQCRARVDRDRGYCCGDRGLCALALHWALMVVVGIPSARYLCGGRRRHLRCWCSSRPELCSLMGNRTSGSKTPGHSGARARDEPMATVAVYVVRHAHAQPRDGWTGPDDERPLTDRAA